MKQSSKIFVGMDVQQGLKSYCSLLAANRSYHFIQSMAATASANKMSATTAEPSMMIFKARFSYFRNSRTHCITFSVPLYQSPIFALRFKALAQ